MSKPIFRHSGIVFQSLQAKNSYLISGKCIESNEFGGYVELTTLSDFCEFWLRRNPAKTEIRLTLNINRALSAMSFLSDSVLLQLSKTIISVLFYFYLFVLNSFFRCFILSFFIMLYSSHPRVWSYNWWVYIFFRGMSPWEFESLKFYSNNWTKSYDNIGK